MIWQGELTAGASAGAIVNIGGSVSVDT